MTAQEEAIEARYQELCREPSDINLHLPVLRQYADQCEHVTEFGTRACVSLHAFLASKAKTVVAYDIANVAVPASKKLTFINADVLTVEIEPTDLLHIDTKHTSQQFMSELVLHAEKVGKWIAAHDWFTFGEHGEDGKPGLRPALIWFLQQYPHWRICYQTDANNGLVIIERI